MRPSPRALVLAAVLCTASAGLQSQPAAPRPDSAELHHGRGVEHHLARRLDDASREYARALELDPPRDLTVDELAIVRRFAPRVYTTPTEPFPLKDFAVILHPARRVVAYHFFWEDDIDFPEDNDPCDHEVVWVQYAAEGKALEEIWTYFHGRLLAGGEPARRDARRHGMRPRIDVQWGKHGSLPVGWEQLTIKPDDGAVDQRQAGAAHVTVKQYNEETYRTLTTKGRRLKEHPIGQRLGWPERFAGTWADFVNFSQLVDPVALLDKSGMVKVSRWNSATINGHFLPYNFRPKIEWPPEPTSAE